MSQLHFGSIWGRVGRVKVTSTGSAAQATIESWFSVPKNWGGAKLEWCFANSLWANFTDTDTNTDTEYCTYNIIYNSRTVLSLFQDQETTDEAMDFNHGFFPQPIF